LVADNVKVQMSNETQMAKSLPAAGRPMSNEAQISKFKSPSLPLPLEGGGEGRG
jgi:hypothetical protein